MSRGLHGWRCLPRSRPKLLMTRSNWEVGDGAEPSLVNKSSSTFSLFWTIEHRVGRPADGPVRLGWLKSSRHRVKSLGPGLARHAVRLTLQSRMTLDDSLHVLCTGPHQCHNQPRRRPVARTLAPREGLAGA